MSEKIKVQELTIDGTVYVPKESVSNYQGDVKIVILQRGRVFIGRFERIGNDCKLHNASNIRVWGTTKGLGELIKGPTKDTILDYTGLVEFDYLTVVATINVNPNAWKGQ
jgi:hypothetical protein